MAPVLLYTLIVLLMLGLALWIWGRTEKTRRLEKLKRDFRKALTDSDEEEAVALGRAYYYLLNGHTGIDDEERIRRDWQAIQKNKNKPASKRSSSNLFTL